MKKIKIGILGADTFEYGICLISSFKNAELFSVFETNKARMKNVISAAIEKGFYIKSYNNADDFYSSAPDVVLVGKTMHEYIRNKNSFLAGGFCDDLHAIEKIAAEKDGKLYFYQNGDWTEPGSFDFSANEQLIYIKSGKNPVIAFFILKQREESDC